MSEELNEERVFAEVNNVTEEIEGAREVEKTYQDENERSELLSVKLNLLEVSHRDVEAIEQYRYKLIAKKMSDDERIKLFKDFIFDRLIVKDEVSGINAAR
jgi:hypothetical protein